MACKAGAAIPPQSRHGRTQVRRRRDVDASVCERSHVDDDVMTGGRQMPRCRLAPGPSHVSKIGACSGKMPIPDHAHCISLHDTTVVRQCDPLRPEARLFERSERVHQVNMRIARLVVEHPIDDEAARRQLGCDVVLHQRDVLRARQFERQGDHNLARILSVSTPFRGDDGVPKRFARFGRRAPIDERAEPLQASRQATSIRHARDRHRRRS